jgi:hypothetical protein
VGYLEITDESLNQIILVQPVIKKKEKEKEGFQEGQVVTGVVSKIQKYFVYL